jgi:hypothetical protein
MFESFLVLAMYVIPKYFHFHYLIIEFSYSDLSNTVL